MKYCMNKIVRILAFSISLTILLNMAAFAESSQTKESLFEDIGESRYKTAIDCISALGFIDGYNDHTFRPDLNITRAEYVKIIMSALGLKDASEYHTNTVFEDVTDNHWAAGYIQSAYDMGLVNGDENKLFNPDADITYAEAVKILVCALGYEIYAEEKGGYPTGYIKVANNKDLFDNIEQSADDFAIRGAVAQLVYNSLDVEVLEQTGFGEEEEYSVIDGNTILTANNIVKIEGLVKANSKTSLIGNSNLETGEIVIDGTQYTVSEQYAEKYLGYNVVAYYKHSTSSAEKEILYMHEQDNRNKTIIIQSEDIDEISSDINMMRTVRYWDEEISESRQQTAVIAASADVIYNGRALLTYQASDLIPAIGEIVLLDNNNDRIYDVVFVTSYVNYIVDDMSSDSGVINDKDGKPTLNLKDEDIDTVIIFNGGNIEIGEIQKNDVLSVADSKTQSGEIFRTVYVSRNKIQGIVSAVNEDKVVINDKKYTVSGRYGYEVKADEYGNMEYDDNSYVIPLKIGDEGLFHIDIYGNIAGYTRELSSGKHIGYIINASQKYDNVMFKIITMDNEIVVYKTADEIEFDGRSNVTNQQLTNSSLSFLSNNGETISNPIFTENGFEQQLIYFELNRDLEIKSIDTSKYCAGEDEDTLQLSSQMHSMKYNNTGTKIWSASAGGYIVDDNVTVFVIPPDAATATDETMYLLRDKSFFVNKTWYNCEIYNGGDMRTSDLLVAKLPTSISTSASLFIVKHIEEAIDLSGRRTINICGLQNGKEATLVCADDMLDGSADPKILDCGDAVRCLTGYNGEVIYVSHLYDADGTNSYMESSSNFETNPLFIYGKVVEKKENIITVSGITDPDTKAIVESNAQPYSVGGANIYICESRDNRKFISTGTAADIQRQDDVYIRIYDTKLRDIIIYR